MFPRVDEADYDWPDANGGDGPIVERATGERFLRVVEDVLGSGDPEESGVSAFTVRDGWIVLLRPEGWQPRVRTTVTATRLITSVVGTPSEPVDVY